MKSLSLDEHIKQIDDWMKGVRVIHLEDDIIDQHVYTSISEPILDEHLSKIGENIRWDCVSDKHEFEKECRSNSLKAVVVSDRLSDGTSCIKEASRLVDEGVIKCPVFILSENGYDGLSDDERFEAVRIGANCINKRDDADSVRENIRRMVA